MVRWPVEEEILYKVTEEVRELTCWNKPKLTFGGSNFQMTLVSLFFLDTPGKNVIIQYLYFPCSRGEVGGSKVGSSGFSPSF